ncbi:unnamed protein product, partial [Prorocentrum cordatum]
ENMQPEAVDFIISAVSSEAEQMASHSFGCRVIQRLVERCPHEQIGNLLDKLTASVGMLSQDPSCNGVSAISSWKLTFHENCNSGWSG